MFDVLSKKPLDFSVERLDGQGSFFVNNEGSENL
jgi:hypothetical protein